MMKYIFCFLSFVALSLNIGASLPKDQPVATPSDDKDSIHHQKIVIEEPWARVFSQSGAVYMTLSLRPTEKTDRLIRASTDVAEKVEIHTHQVDPQTGVAKMRSVSGLDITPEQKTILKPHGLHIMLLKIKKNLKPGSSFKLTLTFEKSGIITIDVPVKSLQSATHVISK
jgi:periplasmic copper chaperone A